MRTNQIISLMWSLCATALSPLLSFIPSLKKRKDFESRNHTDPLSRPFEQRADLAIEASSEGELEQMIPLIHWAIELKMTVELIICSESAERKAQSLTQGTHNRLRFLRLPLLSTFKERHELSKWISASLLVICKYDFFPQLLALKDQGITLILIQARLKKKNSPAPLSFISKIFMQENSLGPYELWVLRQFEHILTLTEKDQAMLKKAQFNASCVGDLRSERILKRHKNAGQHLRNTPKIQRGLEILQRRGRDQVLILGNAWPEDLAIFENQNMRQYVQSGQVLCLVAPHRTDNAYWPNFVKEFQKRKLDFQDWDESSEEEFNFLKGHIIVLRLRGVLAELYTLAATAYVGGGLGKGVHSLLEPAFTCNRVYCGPSVKKSDELSLIQDLGGEVTVLKDLSLFYEKEKKYRDQSFHDLNEGQRPFQKGQVPQTLERTVKILKDYGVRSAT